MGRRGGKRAKAEKEEEEKEEVELVDAAIYEPDKDKEGLVGCICFFFFSLLVYVRTLFPTVPGGDSGELITVAYQLGVPHPPGYPLFAVVMKLFIEIFPFGSIAWRVNLLNAVFSSFANAVLYYIVFRLTRKTAATLLATCLFAFSTITWTYSVTGEVFALNNLFICLVLLFSLDFHFAKEKLSSARRGIFLSSLGMCNQHTLILFVFPISLWVLFKLRNQISSRPILLAQFAGIFLIGLSPYIYLPIAASHLPQNSWGDTRTVAGFLTHFLRQEYGTFSLSSHSAEPEFMKGITFYIAHLTKEISKVGVVLSVVGVVVALVSRPQIREYVLVCTGCVLFYILFFLSRANLPLDNPLFLGVHHRFWMQPNLVMTIFLGLGIGFLMQLQPSGDKYKAAVIVAAVGIAIAVVATRIELKDESDNWSVRDFGYHILKPLPPGTLLLTKGDLVVNSARYVQVCEKYREDVMIMDQEMMTYEWYWRVFKTHFPNVTYPGTHYHVSQKGGFSMKQLLDANFAKFPIYIYVGFKEGDSSWEKDYELIPYGIPNKIAKKTEAYSFEEHSVASKALLPDLNTFRFASLDKYSNVTWEYVVNGDVMESYHRRALFFLVRGMEMKKNEQQAVKFLDEAEEGFLKIIEGAKFWHIHNSVWKNLGITYQHLMNFRGVSAAREMIRYFEKYLELNGGEDKDTKSIKKAIYQGRNWIRQKRGLLDK